MHSPDKIAFRNGFSLVEVLVAATVFSLGLGGLSLLMLTSVHGSIEAQNQTTAASQAAELAELILLNPAALGHYMNPGPVGGAGCIGSANCSNARWAAGNLARWRQNLEQSLSGAVGVVCRDGTPEDGDVAETGCDGTGGAVVKVFWVEPGHHDDNDEGARRVVLPVAQ